MQEPETIKLKKWVEINLNDFVYIPIGCIALPYFLDGAILKKKKNNTKTPPKTWYILLSKAETLTSRFLSIRWKNKTSCLQQVHMFLKKKKTLKKNPTTNKIYQKFGTMNTSKHWGTLFKTIIYLDSLFHELCIKPCWSMMIYDIWNVVWQAYSTQICNGPATSNSLHTKVQICSWHDWIMTTDTF